MKEFCQGYCGVDCVNGNCPQIKSTNYSIDFYLRENCANCPLYKGCDDCCFKGMEMCVRNGVV